MRDALRAFIAGEPAPMDESDLDAFAGVRGDGYVATTEDGALIVLDAAEDEIIVTVAREDGTYKGFVAKITGVF
jgi:hypothetical protein